MDGGQSGASSPAPSSPARAAVNVVAITTRDDFLLELGEALAGQASINPVESGNQALDQLRDTRRPQILMVDSRDLEDVRREIGTVQSQATHATVLLFAASEQEQEIAASFEGTGVFAVLPLPIDVRRTASVFTEAVADSKAKLAAPIAPGAPLQPTEVTAGHAAPESATHQPIRPQSRQDAGESKFKPPVIAGGAALIVLLAAVTWYFTRNKAPATAVAPVGKTTVPADTSSTVPEPVLPAVETSLVKGKVDELLEKARLAMRERRYAEPAGDNALLYYRSAGAAEPGNGEALDGLTRIASLLATRIEEALGQNQYGEASTALAQFKNALPDDPRVPAFQLRLTSAQFSKAIEDANLERAAALVRSAQQANAVPSAQLAKWRADIARLQDQARAKRETEQAAREAAAAEQKKARDAKAAAAAEAERTAQAAKDKAREELSKREQAAKAAQEATTPRSGATPRDAASLQSQLKRKRYIAPEYPADALSRKVGGAVTIAFTVDSKGEPRDIHVESSQPSGVFDRAAIAAVKRWRYEPLVIDGVPTEVPAKLLIRFAPDE